MSLKRIASLERLIIDPVALTVESFRAIMGWSDGAMVLGKLPVPGRPTNLDYSRGKGLLRLH